MAAPSSIEKPRVGLICVILFPSARTYSIKYDQQMSQAN